MEENDDSVAKETLQKRINHIMEAVGLEVAGFSELTKISESHLYALSNGTKNLTTDMAGKIASPLKLKANQILNVDYLISDSIKNAPAVKKFYATFKKGNPEYFKETKAARKNSYFIEKNLVTREIFNEPVYVWQIKKVCDEIGLDISSKELAQQLDYMAKTNKIKSEKRKLKKKNGEMSEREVWVYFKNPEK